MYIRLNYDQLFASLLVACDHQVQAFYLSQKEEQLVIGSHVRSMLVIGSHVHSMSLFLRNGINTRSAWLKLTPTSPPKTYYFSFAFKDLESRVHLHLVVVDYPHLRFTLWCDQAHIRNFINNDYNKK